MSWKIRTISIGWVLFFIILLLILIGVFGCSTEITYKDFTYKKPILSSQSIQRLEVWVDANDPNKVVRFVLEGQKSDAQAAVDLVEKVASGVISYSVGANPSVLK
jgi:hypothetical protein